MTDLSAIFRNKPSLPSQSSINNRSSYNSQKFSKYGNSNNSKIELPSTSYSNTKTKVIDNDLINLREAKKIVTFFNMEK
jgi:hypothetical protein